MQVIIVMSYYFLTASDNQVMSALFHLSSWFSSWTHLKVHSMQLFQQPQNITVVILYTGKNPGLEVSESAYKAALYSPSQVQSDLLKASRRPCTVLLEKKADNTRQKASTDKVMDFSLSRCHRLCMYVTSEQFSPCCQSYFSALSFRCWSDNDRLIINWA